MDREARTRIRAHRSGRGFTMIELLVVILIVMVLAGIAVPVVGEMVRQSRMNAAASVVSTALRRARNLAISRGEIYCARVATGAPSIDFYRLPEGQIGGPSNWDALEKAGGVVVPEGVRIVSTGSPSQGFLLFLPDGSAWGPGMDTPAAVRVVPDAEHADSRYDEHQDVTIRSLSGSVTVGPRVYRRY